MILASPGSSIFFFNDTATTEIYTLSLHDALPISSRPRVRLHSARRQTGSRRSTRGALCRKAGPDRKSTRLNSSHPSISYAVFCLKKKKMTIDDPGHTLVGNTQFHTISYYGQLPWP